MAGKRRTKGKGSVYERKDGRWTAYLTLEGGKRKWYYGHTKQEVEDQLDDALMARRQGRLITNTTERLGPFLERYLEDVVKLTVKPRTYYLYQGYVAHLRACMGVMKLSAVKPADIQRCYRVLQEEDGISAGYVHECHTVLKRALTQAVAWDLLARNPADSVKPPRRISTEMKTLSAEQVQQLINTSRGSRWHALWVFLVTTGARLGEASALKWSDIDLQARTVLIRRTVAWEPGSRLVLSEPKTPHSRRTVHLTEAACTALREHRVQQNVTRLAASEWDDQGLVFTTRRGTPFYPEWVRAAFNQTLDEAGLPRIRVHDLRHTAATLYLQMPGVHIKQVSEMLGHASIAITLAIYSHVIPRMHQEAADRMDALLKTTSNVSHDGSIMGHD